MHKKNMAISFLFALATSFSAISLASQQPFYRAYNGSISDHFYTTSLTEIINSGSLGYRYEGIACDLVTADDSRKSAPLFRAFSPGQGDHFYTASYPEFINAISSFGYQSEGVAGYMVTSGSDFWRAYRSNGGDHFYTKSYSEWINSAVSHGYLLEGSAGKVL